MACIALSYIMWLKRETVPLNMKST
uniref:Uncharacterized protein n=1 Tax=Anguilla anguilla TaxID=7936 RepID=A0A0E9PAZ6_ANGAN